MKGHPSRTEATAKRVEGETSSWDLSMAARRLAEVSLTPGRISEYLSVLAVQKTTTLSRPLDSCKSGRVDGQRRRVERNRAKTKEP